VIPHLFAQLCANAFFSIFTRRFSRKAHEERAKETQRKCSVFERIFTLIQIMTHLLCETLRDSLCVTSRETLFGSGFHAKIFKRRFHAKLPEHAQRKCSFFARIFYVNSDFHADHADKRRKRFAEICALCGC
jgi:hypothetical protein